MIWLSLIVPCVAMLVTEAMVIKSIRAVARASDEEEDRAICGVLAMIMVCIMAITTGPLLFGVVKMLEGIR